MGRGTINIGLVGLGRLGQVYAKSLATEIPQVRLAAVCDINADKLSEVAHKWGVNHCYQQAGELIEDPRVEAVVIVTSTDTHRPLVEATASAGKPIFCEKPLSISLAEAVSMKRAVEQAGVFFQMGLMRRFDRGYLAAQERLGQGEIGRPVVFKSTSRDPYRPSLEFLDPSRSGGIFVDMGIHDFDLARWLFGPVVRVHSIGGVLAYPEMEPLGEVDNAIVSLTFEDGRLGVVDLSRSGVYGYDIFTEILGTQGTIRIGYLRENPILVLKENRVSHDTVPYFMERFGAAYTKQLEDFAQNLIEGKPPSVTAEDGLEALRVAIAATRSWQSGQPVSVDSITEEP